MNSKNAVTIQRSKLNKLNNTTSSFFDARKTRAYYAKNNEFQAIFLIIGIYSTDGAVVAPDGAEKMFGMGMMFQKKPYVSA